MKRAFTDSEEAQIAVIYRFGCSERALSRAYGKDRLAIKGALRRQGERRRTPHESHELHNRIYTLDEHAFDALDSEHSAYWLGFLSADGSTHNHNISITLKGKDHGHLQSLLHFLGSTAPVRKYVVQKKYPTCQIEVSSAHLADRLRELGVVTHRPNPLTPTKFLTQELQRHFVRGYWDGDGFVATNPNGGVGFCGPRELMIWIKDVIAARSERLDGRRNLSVHPISDIYYLRYGGRRVALAAIDVMFKDATIWLPRKREVVLNWPAPKPRYRNKKGQYT